MSKSQAGIERDVMAKEYEGILNRLFLVQILTLGVLLAIYQFSGASAALADGLARRFGDGLWFATNAVYTLVSVFGFAAFMSPFSYYSGHVLERYYKQTDESTGEWLGDFVQSLVIDLVLATILFSVVYGLLRWVPQWWWLAASVFYIFFGIVISSLIPVVIMPMFHAFEPLSEGDLTEAVQKMLDEAGINVTGIFKWGVEDKAISSNVIFTGFGRKKRIVIGDALLGGYTQDEILAIVAHEMGHCKKRDSIRLMITSGLLALIGFFVAHHVLNHLTNVLGVEHVYDIAAAPIFIFSLFVFSLISMPFSNMHSRRREFEADAYAVRVLGSPDALIRSFEKLADSNLANKAPAAWIEFLLHSHPSMARRIERARQY